MSRQLSVLKIWLIVYEWREWKMNKLRGQEIDKMVTPNISWGSFEI